MDLFVRRTTVGAVSVVTATGEIDLATVPKLRAALQDAILESPASIIAVDLDGVHACDDTGLGIVLGAAARARDGGGDLVIVSTDPRMLQRLDRTRLDRAVQVVGTIAGLKV